MKKYLILGMMLLLMLLTMAGCKKKDGMRKDDLTVITPSGDEIHLYMPREEAEKVLGDGEKSSDSNIYYYDDRSITIGYKDGVIGYIYTEAVGYKTKSGAEVGQPFTLPDDWTDTELYSKSFYKKGSELTDTIPSDFSMTDFYDTSSLYAVIGAEGISSIMIQNMGWLMEGSFEE